MEWREEGRMGPGGERSYTWFSEWIEG